MEGIWSWSYAWEVLPYLLDGLVVTLQATALGFGFALVGGLVLAVLRQPGRQPARWSGGWFV